MVWLQDTGVLQKIYALGMRSFSSSKASAFELREEAGGFLPGLLDTWTHLLLYLKGSLGQILVPYRPQGTDPESTSCVCLVRPTPASSPEQR